MRPLRKASIMDNREIAKTVVRYTAEIGAGIIIKEIIKNNVTTPTRIDKKIAVWVAAFAIAGYVGMKASKQIEALFDEIYRAYDDIMKNKHKLTVIK